MAPLVAILADPKQSAAYPVAKEMLVELDGYAVAPLIGVLESPDAALKTQVVEVLGRLRAPEAVAPLLGQLVAPAGTPQLRAATAAALRRIGGQVPGGAEAVQLLEHAARRALVQSRSDGRRRETPTEVWHWNRQTP